MAGIDVHVATLGGLVLQIAAKIQQLGDDWYRASAAWEDFPRKVDLLRQKCDFWQAEFSKFGMLSDANLMTTLEKARSLLAVEEDKITKRQARGRNTCGTIFCSKLSMAVFPAKIGLSIQRVNEAFDAIPDSLKFQEDGHNAMQKKPLREPSSLGIREDAHNRYVHLEASESEVCSTLDDPAGPTVVLLHGGAGRGKSTLARHIALHYDKTGHFDLVVILLCGPAVETLPTQLTLLTRLGVDTTSFSDERQPCSSSSIPKLLEGVLKDKNILIIFDDVWDGDFLQEMVNLCGNGVKCLVTSRDGNLCQGLNFSALPIKIKVVEEDARKILASHVGFPNQLIPEEIKGLANRIVQVTEGNPLALALIATGIDHNRSDELETWEAASSNFFQLLHSQSTAHVLGDKYPKSFISAMQLSMQSLSKDAKNLLVLTHLCEGPSVPEEVVRMIYNWGKIWDFSSNFEQLRQELESRELLKVYTRSDELIRPRKYRSWSIHSLQHLFIENEMRDQVELMLKPLATFINEMNSVSRMEPDILGKIPTDEDIIVIVALYLHSRFYERVASKIGIIGDRFDKLRRDAIEPVTRLLGQPTSARWTAAAQSSTRQAFLTYIYNGQLHSEGLLHLLSMPVSTFPTLLALASITFVENTVLLNESTHGLVKGILHLLGDSHTHDSVKKLAVRVVHSLLRDQRHKHFITSAGVFEEILRVLLSESPPDLHFEAAHVLFLLSQKDDRRVEITNFPRAVELLVDLLSKDNYPALQANAAKVLSSISGINVDETNLQIIDSPGVVQQLVESLSKDDNSPLQMAAAEALHKLATTDQTRRKRFLSHWSSLPSLSLSNDELPGLQDCAAGALAEIRVEEMCWKPRVTFSS